ncbi:hypothetical protein E8E14_005573 [Neopestalotiopsis sp. 37M]|nr:hypothetical protein E8E14_005573 [Neopestalotiopsis sp. 37M]
MQMIYEGADRALIWLGEAIPYRSRDAYYGIGDFKYQASLGLTRGKVSQLCNYARTGRAWWSRIWVVQEMIVARRLYVCIGLHLLRWDKFAQVMSEFNWHGDLGVLADAKERIKQLDGLRKNWWKVKHSLDFLELLGLGRNSYATDSKDNIYGLIGLMKTEERERICVDYNRRTDLVYAETTAILIERQRSLDFLVKAFTSKKPQSQPSLPSWVLDFGDSQGVESMISGKSHLRKREMYEGLYDGKQHQASANSTPSSCFHASSLKLDLEVIIFDSINTSTEPLPSNWYNRKKSNAGKIISGRLWVKAALKLLEATLQVKPLPSDPRSCLHRRHDTKRLLFDFLNRGRYDKLDFEDFIRFAFADIFKGDDYTDPSKWRRPSEVDRKKRDNIWNTLYSLYQQLVIFTTASGFVGVAEYDRRSKSPGLDTKETSAACPGDVIAIPLGSSKPWIVRKTGADGEYRLIVDCIIPDVMSGEVMKLVEAKQMETQWLTRVKA